MTTLRGTALLGRLLHVWRRAPHRALAGRIEQLSAHGGAPVRRSEWLPVAAQRDPTTLGVLLATALDARGEVLRTRLDALAADGPSVAFDVHSYNHRRDGAGTPASDPVDNPEVNVGTGSLDRDRWGHVVDSFIDALAAAPVEPISPRTMELDGSESRLDLSGTAPGATAEHDEDEIERAIREINAAIQKFDSRS